MSSHDSYRSRAFADEEPAELDGLRVVFDQKVALFPAEMQKKPIGRTPAARRTGAFSRGPARRKRQQRVGSYGRP